MTAAQKALEWAIGIANDQSHGYSQANRWGPDYDCSSLVITAYQVAGVPVKESGATYTGNMLAVFKKCGFVDVTAKVNLNNGSGMQPGDVLMYHISGTSGHTAMYAGSGKIVHARGQSYGSSKTGDQGTEIAVTAYSRSKWQYVLRYTGEAKASGSANTSAATPTVKRYPVSTSMPIIKTGSIGRAVKVWQTVIGADADGEFGPNTKAATLQFQKANNLEQDAEVGPNTWAAGLKSIE